MTEKTVQPLTLTKEQAQEMEESFFYEIIRLKDKYEIGFSDALFGWKEINSIKANMAFDPETLKKMMES